MHVCVGTCEGKERLFRALEQMAVNHQIWVLENELQAS